MKPLFTSTKHLIDSFTSASMAAHSRRRLPRPSKRSGSLPRKPWGQRMRNDDEDAKEELYSLVIVAEIPAEGLKGLGTKVIDDDEE
ncbi:putative 60S ribosomal protein L31 [Corchorus olitorius]|uniref:60S ribosomal protein L31 n=1 Tax=Corchorus olitorius TaxID=93759 RepID=A0A1R3G5Q8_9ROSI|nr:putative 60S ribosomal protein L31 [Corchorus olitorius]